MAPLSTFRLRPGFLGSLRLLIRLRTRFRYFMSVLLSSWWICDMVKGQLVSGGGAQENGEPFPEARGDQGQLFLSLDLYRGQALL